MPDETPANNSERKLRQEQPRKAPATPRGNLVYVVGAGVIVLAVAGAAVLMINPSWLPFFGGPADIVLESGSQIVFNGLASAINAGQGNTVVQGVPDESRATVIIRSTRKNARLVGTTEGAYVQLKPDVSSDLAGKRVRITVWARQGASNPSALFAIAYSSGTSGSSGWIAFDPTNELKPYTFGYKVPAAATGNSTGDYIGVWSDVSGAGGALEVRLITVQVVEQPS